MNTLRLSLGFLIIFFFCNNVVFADSDIVRNPDNGHLYQRIDTPMTWTDANNYCDGLGGYLATITSSAENEFIYNEIHILDFHTWLGGTDAVQEGTWEWITGEPWVYENWDTFEPNDPSMGGEDYLEIRTTGFWNDHGLPNNDDEHPFICEFVECFPDAEWKNHGMYVRCVAHEVGMLVGAGIITEEEGDAMVSGAAQSDVGK